MVFYVTKMCAFFYGKKSKINLVKCLKMECNLFHSYKPSNLVRLKAFERKRRRKDKVFDKLFQFTSFC